jgi:hypothetical protein
VKRSLSGLVVALSLFACKEEPRGALEPIPRPPGMNDTPAPAEAKAPAAPAQPAVDPSKVTLRWKLAAGTPVTYRLTLERTGRAPEATEPEAGEKPTRGRKGRGKAKAAAPAEEKAPASASFVPTALTFVLEHTDSGDAHLRVIPESRGAPPPEDEGTLSERGFVLAGLQGMTRNTATLVLELPRDAVGPNDTWSLATELVSPDALGAYFQGPTPERRNRVKLTGLAPADGGEQVATVEYDIYELRTGKVRTIKKPTVVPAREGVEAMEASGSTEADVSAEVKITGRGEFLVKAGRWRSWEGTLSTVTKGPFPPEALQVPPGNLALRLTALESAPQPTAQPQK